MFPVLDQIAFKLLFLLYGLFGVKDIPQHIDPNWQITERWAPHDGNTYRFVMESNSIKSLCANKSDYIVAFPTTSLSIINLYVDGKLFQTNSNNGGWNLSQVSFRPMISCRILQNHESVKLEIISSVVVMNVVRSYPEIRKRSIIFNFVNADPFYSASIIVIIMTLINALVILIGKKKKDFYLSITQDLGIAITAMWFSPGKFMDVPLQRTNESFLSILIIAVFSYGRIANLITKKMFIAAVVGVSIIYLLSINSFNLIYFMTLVAALIIIVWLIYVPFVLLRKERSSPEKKILYVQIFIMFLVPFLVISDGVESSFLFNNFTTLPLALILFPMVNFLNNVRIMSEERINALVIENENAQKSNLISALEQKQNIYYEIIHDIKSPISGLNFMLSTKEFQENKILISAKDRLSELLARCEVYLRGTNLSWINTELIINSVKELFIEYSDRLNLVLNTPDNLSGRYVHTDALGIKVVVAELIDNCIKAGVAELAFNVDNIRNQNGEHFRLSMTVLRKKESSDSIKGYSSGRGLAYVNSKVKSWGGSIEIDRDTYNCTIVLPLK